MISASPSEPKNRKPCVMGVSHVIPAEAGIQVLQSFLDPGLRRGDGINPVSRAKISAIAVDGSFHLEDER